MKPYLAILAINLVLASGCAAKQASVGQRPPAANQKVKVGAPAPPFALKDVDGKPVTLAQFRGKAVFINMFATWCPPCQLELPGIVKSYPQYKDKIVYIGVDEQEDAEQVKPFLKRFGMTYHIALDPGPVADSYQVISLPESVFIDQNGVVRQVIRGFMTPKILKDNLALIINP